jgi:hypothetical protein
MDRTPLADDVLPPPPPLLLLDEQAVAARQHDAMTTPYLIRRLIAMPFRFAFCTGYQH